MLEKIIHFVIVNMVPTPRQLEYIEQARRLHPTWEIKVWTDPIEPSAYELGRYHSRVNSGAQKADLLRLEVVYRYGGFYLDSDVFLVKALDPFLSLPNMFCSEDGQFLSTGVFAAPRGSDLLRIIINDLLVAEPNWMLPPNETTGPHLFSKVLRWRSDMFLVPRETFYPYNWNEAVRPALQTTYGVHEWAASWKQITSETIKKQSITVRALKLAQRLITKPLPTDHQRRRMAAAYRYGRSLLVAAAAAAARSLAILSNRRDLPVASESAVRNRTVDSTLRFIKLNLRGGDYFLEVGEGVGLFALLAAEIVGPFGRIFAFEADNNKIAHLYQLLRTRSMHERVILRHVDTVGRSTLKSVPAQLSSHVGGPVDDASPNQLLAGELSGVNEERGVNLSAASLDELFPYPVELKILMISDAVDRHLILKNVAAVLTQHNAKYIVFSPRDGASYGLPANDLSAVQLLQQHGYEQFSLSAVGALIPSVAEDKLMLSSHPIVFVRPGDVIVH